MRWWLTRDTAATADTDFTEQRLAARADEDLAHGIGNAVNRVASLVHRYRDGAVPNTDAEPVGEASALPEVVAALLATFERRAATTAILDALAALNRDLDDDAPVGGGRRSRRAGELDALLDRHHRTTVLIADVAHADRARPRRRARGPADPRTGRRPAATSTRRRTTARDVSRG